MSTNIDLCAALQEKLGNHEMKECAALVQPHAFLPSVSFKSSYFNFPLFSLVIVRILYPSHILQVIVKFTLHSKTQLQFPPWPIKMKVYLLSHNIHYKIPPTITRGVCLLAGTRLAPQLTQITGDLLTRI